MRKSGNNFAYFARAFENQDYDLATNGEEFVLQRVGQVCPQAVVFDVGAHRGEWAGMAARHVPKGKIQSFEAVPDTYRHLVANVGHLPNVAVHPLALGEQAGELEFSVAAGRDDLSSGVAGVHGEMHRFDFTRVKCPVTAGAQWCAEQGIARIDFLKIDVEGMEPAVIRGFAPMLARGEVGAIQFEYGQINLQARFFLGDFYELLGAYDMAMGKLYPTYVDFRDYQFTDDTLTGPNYVAVSRRNPALIEALA